MATAVAAYTGDLLVRDWLKRGIPQRKTGSDDSRNNGLRSHIKALVGYWETLHHTGDLKGASSHHGQTGLCATKKSQTRELFRPVAMPQIAVPPPLYSESLDDLPPDYTLTDTLAAVQLAGDATLLSVQYEAEKKSGRPAGSSDIDLTSPEGIRSHANKKAKKAAKQAQVSALLCMIIARDQCLYPWVF